MARVTCEVIYTVLENEDGREVDGVAVACGECGHEEESYGTAQNSIRRCLVLLRENCPKGQLNFYAVVSDPS